VALRCKDGVAFAIEKIITSRLYESGSNKRIHNIDKHIGMVWKIYLFKYFIRFYLKAVAGLLADARQLISVARDEAKQYKYDYGVSIPVKVWNEFYIKFLDWIFYFSI
jgi:20S proteasome subunit alpha 7